MDHPRLKMGYRRDESKPPNVFADLNWALDHHDELLEQYGEAILIIYKEQVLGVGDSVDGALQDAIEHLPPGDDVLTPALYILGKRHPFFRVYPHDRN